MQLQGGIYGKREVIMLDPFILKASEYNPPNRTDPRALAKLKRAVVAAGAILSPIHVVENSDDGYTIKDGHRRTEVAKLLGLKVPALIYDGNADTSQLFNQLNVSGRAFKPADQLIAYLRGGEPVSKSIQQKGDYLRSLLSDLELELFMDGGYGPFLLKIGQNMADYCYPGHRHSEPIARAFIRKSIVWLMKNNQQQPVRRYMEEFKGSAKDLVKFVENDEPVVFKLRRARAV